MMRTHTCGELKSANAEETVTLCGWVDRKRDIGQLQFVSLRDRYGTTQCVWEKDSNDTGISEKLDALHLEDCVAMTGIVKLRSQKDQNAEMTTGEIEIYISQVEILNSSKSLPFQVKDNSQASDELRLKYRYLDLRRPKMQANLQMRHKVVQATRKALVDQGFLEIETPLLIRSTPEGARDFVVPSRTHPGKFYALPQSPQLYKQMLMVSGCDRYFQFAQAFRDEDLRADRVPVHTQIDMEMSFVNEQDVFHAVEKYLEVIFTDTKNLKIPTPFPIMDYQTAFNRYGNDKPDTRFELHLQTVTDILQQTELELFQKASCIRAIMIPDGNSLSRKDIDSLQKIAQSAGASGLGWSKKTNGTLSGGVSKFLADCQHQLDQKTQAPANCLFLFVADEYNVCCRSLSAVRLELGQKLGLIDDEKHHFLWVNKFPLFELNNETGSYAAMHHLFTQPLVEDLPLLDSDPSKVRGQLYDLVLNGVELLSGSIRINQPEIQQKVLDIVKMPAEESRNKFGFLMDSFSYGAPPHGGSAMGLDRLVAILCGETSIREVIAYPCNNAGIFPLDGSPAPLDQQQLDELNLQMMTREEDVAGDK